MSKKCAITGKKAGKGKRYSFLRSHFNPTALRRFHPNLQKVKVIIDGVPQKIIISTKVLKTFPELKTGISSKELKKGRGHKRIKRIKAAK